MFRYFERLIDPVATPSGVSPPAGTLAFYWHFIRQHKPIFAALIVLAWEVRIGFSEFDEM